LAEKKRILIVDDDKEILKTFKNILQSKGYYVDIAETGRDAAEKSRTKYYNLALLDIKLPDVDGTTLLTEMHRDTPRMMKVMVTGYPSLENVAQALNLGADAYIMKPVDPEHLLKVVEQKLKEQENAESMTQEKVVEWIRNRIRKLE